MADKDETLIQMLVKFKFNILLPHMLRNEHKRTSVMFGVQYEEKVNKIS